MKKKKFRVLFQPSNKTGEVLKESTIIEAARELGVKIESLCGGFGQCGKCKIILRNGKLSPFTEEEAKFIPDSEFRDGYRLACAARIKSDVTIFVPEESLSEEAEIRKSVSAKLIKLQPAILPYYIELVHPSLDDPLGDFDRLKKALSERYSLFSLNIDYPMLLKLPHLLRQGNWKVTVAVWMDEEILDIKPNRVDDLYGIAIDIGTTTIAGYLCNLRNGDLLATESILNPQVVYGEDVMSRIHYILSHPDGLEKLHCTIIDGLNQLIQTTTQKSNLSSEDILELTIVGNTVMHHLLLKIDPQYLGTLPFTPAIHKSINLKARELGLRVNPSANVYVLPIEGGFVGADNVGVLISQEPYLQDEMLLIVDIGTNGELVMVNRKRLTSCSCATGPAFEGGHIKFGMRAAWGAIERVKIDPETLDVNFKVIGDPLWQSESKSQIAKGICGSGIIDVVAELFGNGIIDQGGHFKKNISTSRFRIAEGEPEFVIAWKDQTSIGREITITQRDIRNVQLAKSAIYTGAKLMMRRLGIEHLDKIILAGAFGNYIDPKQALRLGMFPDCPSENVYSVGNAAGEGARIALLNREKRAEAEEIARNVEYMELTVEEDFQKEFIEALHFPPIKDF